MLTNPFAEDYADVTTNLSNPGNIDYDNIIFASDFVDLIGYNKDSVTFKAKSNVVISGQGPISINFKFMQGLREISTSQLLLSVGVPIHTPAGAALDGLTVESDLEDGYSDEFFLEASNYFDGTASTNVASGVQLGISYGPWSATIRTQLMAVFSENQPNVTAKFGTEMEATVETFSVGPISHVFSAEISQLFRYQGTPENMAALLSTLIYNAPNDWKFKSIGLSIGVEDSNGLQHGKFWNPEPWVIIRLRVKF